MGRIKKMEKPGENASDLIWAARVSATVIVTGFLFYWYGEILSAIELLRMAYG